MNGLISKKAKALTYLLMVVYFASYITRINFSVMIVKICSEMALQKSELAVIITGLTVCYGTGQIISGILGDKIKPSMILGIGLFSASVCNILITLTDLIPLMTIIWCVNGFAQSMLWPPIVRIMSSSLSDLEYNFACVRVSWGSSFATVTLYLLCPILLSTISWKTIMLICSTVGFSIFALWCILSPNLVTNGMRASDKTESKEEVKSVPAPKFVFIALAFIIIGIILQGSLRDGVTNWMPSYMSEAFGLSEENAIITAVLPAILSILSFTLFEYLMRCVFKDEILCAASIFVIAVIFASLLSILSTFLESVIISTLLLALIIACMHGINLMLITIVPKRFKKSGKVSTYSGVLNACTYIGASLSNYGFAVLAESKGWGFTTASWIFIALLGAAVCFAAFPTWKKFRREYSDNENI